MVEENMLGTKETFVSDIDNNDDGEYIGTLILII
jgi:hypothetical protein